MPRYAAANSQVAILLSNGHRMYVDARDERGRRLLDTNGNLNPSSLSLWQLALDLHPWQAVVDVGCNSGEMIVLPRLPEGATVIAFEPNPYVLPNLERTLAEFSRPVDLLRCAVAAQTGRSARFTADTEWSGTSTLMRDHKVPGPHEVELAVEVTSLDEVLVSRGFSSACVKVDVEGWEVDVLLGARGFLSGLDRWAVMVEILHMPVHAISELAMEFNMYVLDQRCCSLVRLYGGNTDLVRDVLRSGWSYPQDALLLSSPEVASRE